MAKTVQDKKKTNFIIACGYCLVVIVILINYLTTPSNKKPYRDGTKPAHLKNSAKNSPSINDNKLLNIILDYTFIKNKGGVALC